MSSDDTKPKIDDTETEEDKSSQDEAEPEKSAEADVKKEEEKGKDDKSAAGADDEGTDVDGDTEEEEVKKPAKKRPVKADDDDEEEKDAKEEDDKETEDDEEDGVDEDEKTNGVVQKDGRGRKKGDKKNDDKKDKKEEIEIPNGKGTPLGECPIVEHFIKQREVHQLKKLHTACYGKAGKPDQIKENLLQFKGFEYEPESDAYTKKKQAVAKMDFKHMKEICEILDLEKKGKKDDIVTRIMDFLMEPKDSGKPVPAVPPPRPKRSSAVKANNRGYAGLDSDDDEEGGRRGRATGRRAKARPSYKDESSSEEDKRGRRGGRKFSDSDAESEPELTPSDDDDSDSHKKKKATPAKTKGRGAPKKKPTPAPKSAKRVAPKRGKKKASDSEAPSESEDEPLQKKSKKFPSDDEIKKYVKQILDGANLEEITMKTVCKQVYGRYPEHDLTNKKDLIKSTVKSLIAT